MQDFGEGSSLAGARSAVGGGNAGATGAAGSSTGGSQHGAFDMDTFSPGQVLVHSDLSSASGSED